MEWIVCIENDYLFYDRMNQELWSFDKDMCRWFVRLNETLIDGS